MIKKVLDSNNRLQPIVTKQNKIRKTRKTKKHMASTDQNVIKAFQVIRGQFLLDNNALSTDILMKMAIALIPMIQDMISEPARGPYKKNVLIAVLNMVIDKYVPESERETMKMIVRSVVSPAVDGLIDVARGRLDLHKFRKGCMSCLPL